jgi:hypothetical protein
MKTKMKLVPFVLFGLCLVFNSCSEENYEDSQIANISEKLSLTSSRFNEVSINAIPKSNYNQTPVFLSNENAAIVGITALNSLDNLNSLMSFSRTYDLNISDTVDSQATLLQTFYVDENIVLQTLQPNILEAKSFLSSQGFTDADYIEVFGSAHSELIVTAAIFVSAELSVSKDISGREIFLCAMGALGARDLASYVGGRALSGFAARRALLGIVRASAVRAGLGPIGVAIMVAEFGYCLYEADQD